MTKQSDKSEQNDWPEEFIQIGANFYVLYHLTRTNTQMAKDLSFTHTWEDVPGIRVRWEPGSHYYPATPETIHKYHVYMEGIADRCDWEITGKTMGELGKKLADSMEELAKNLKNASAFLSDRAMRIRLEAEAEARRTKWRR